MPTELHNCKSCGQRRGNVCDKCEWAEGRPIKVKPYTLVQACGNYKPKYEPTDEAEGSYD